MTESDPPEQSVATPNRPRTAAERRDRVRITTVAVIGALVVVFALLNLGNVKVHWLVATGNTPLILVVVLAFALGMLADRLLVVRARRKRRAAS